MRDISRLKVGTMVRRSYVWPKLVYGIICEIIEEEVIEEWEYVILTAKVVWSDGTVTEELYTELELMEDDLK